MAGRLAATQNNSLKGRAREPTQGARLSGAYVEPVFLLPAVGAGEGEIVLYASGSSARQTELTRDRPVDAVVMAIVDSWDVGGEERYHKGREEGRTR